MAWLVQCVGDEQLRCFKVEQANGPSFGGSVLSCLF